LILQNFCIFIIVSTKKENNKEVRVNIRLTENLRMQYKKYCLKNNLDMSKHIRDFIEKTVNNKK